MRTYIATDDHDGEAFVVKQKDGTEVLIDSEGKPFAGEEVNVVYELPKPKEVVPNPLNPASPKPKASRWPWIASLVLVTLWLPYLFFKYLLPWLYANILGLSITL